MADDVRIEVTTGPDGPLLIKWADGPAARDRLAREAERLRRLRHPGVVELLDHADDHLTIAWAGTHTLALVKPSIADAAAILADVATTVADLHEVGIVHGRLDPAHVVIGPEGRPRLCGLAGPGPGGGDPPPADDVAAIGGLIDGVLGPGAELEPIPDRRWGQRRWTGYQRRALQTLADQATDPDPARRPTARALAAAIRDAVPEDRARGRGATARWSRLEGPTPPLPEGGRDADPQAPPVGRPPFRLDIVDHDRPGAPATAAAAAGPSGMLPEPVLAEPLVDEPLVDEPVVAEPVVAEPTAAEPTAEEVDVTEHRAGAAVDDRPWDDRGERAGEVAVGSTGDDAPSMTSAGSSDRLEESAPVAGGHEHGQPSGTGVPWWIAWDAGEQQVGSAAAPRRPVPASQDEGGGGDAAEDHGAGPDAVWSDRLLGLRVDRPATAHQPVVRPRLGARAGAAPSGSGPAEAAAGRPSRAVLATVGAVAVGLVSWILLGSGGTSSMEVTRPSPNDEQALRSTTTAPAPASTSAPDPEAASSAPGCAPVAGPSADVDGDGCAEAVEVDGTAVTAGGATFDVGRAGDRIAVGDWDCDGQATPGIVRPSTGEVFLFGGWAGDGRPVTVDPVAVVPGAADLQAPAEIDRSQRCPPPTVRLVDRSTRPLDGTGA
ncbi:MAG TPA: hypothetical protein VHK88_01985 [Aquihabitans sp.]|jgi:hypothetical protein|nr:hypothetical protein [Aquihabitans sp.]